MKQENIINGKCKSIFNSFIHGTTNKLDEDDLHLTINNGIIFDGYNFKCASFNGAKFDTCTFIGCPCIIY